MTGGQGLFRADDNPKAALRQFYQLLYAGKNLPRTGSGVEGCSLTAFQDATGLDLIDQDGSLKEELPPRPRANGPMPRPVSTGICAT